MKLEGDTRATPPHPAPAAQGSLQDFTLGLLHEYMGQKRRKCPKKRVSSLLQLRSQRGLPGRTARAFGALPGTQGVRLTDQTE